MAGNCEGDAGNNSERNYGERNPQIHTEHTQPHKEALLGCDYSLSGESDPQLLCKSLQRSNVLLCLVYSHHFWPRLEHRDLTEILGKPVGMSPAGFGVGMSGSEQSPVSPLPVGMPGGSGIRWQLW